MGFVKNKKLPYQVRILETILGNPRNNSYINGIVELFCFYLSLLCGSLPAFTVFLFKAG